MSRIPVSTNNSLKKEKRVRRRSDVNVIKTVETRLAASGVSTADQPTNTSPTDGETGVDVGTTLTASTYSGTDFHIHSIWVIYSDAGGTTEVYNSKATTDLTSHVIPETAPLLPETQYWFGVRYIGVGSISAESTLTSFTTDVAFSSLFATSLYTGTGANQSIISGLDFISRDGLLWIKNRSQAYVHTLFDTVRGVTKFVQSNSTSAESTASDLLQSFNSDGFTYGTSINGNGSGDNIVAWQFLEESGFFDITTYTGDGVAGRTVPIDLDDGTAQFGMALVKRRDAGGIYMVQHKDVDATDYLALSSNLSADTATSIWNSTAATTTALTLGSNDNVNGSAGTYVAYLFAHNPSKGIFCGSYAGTSSAGNKVTTGFPVGWLLIKNTTLTGDWDIFDISRDPTNPNGNLLNPNLNNAEVVFAGSVNFLSDGFDFTGAGRNSSGSTYIFMAIADPNTF